jgi:hypothetical protein
MGTKTSKALKYERLDKEMNEKGYIPPPDKPIRANTKGRFHV